MTSLYELTGSYLALQQYADPIDPETGEVSPGDDSLAVAFAEIADAIEVKIGNCAHVVRSWEAEAAAIEDEERRLRERRRGIASRAERLRGLMRDAMVATGQAKIRSTTDSIYLSKPRESVAIDNADAIPDDLCIIKREPAKAAIKAALAEGRAVPGARLELGQSSLVIR